MTGEWKYMPAISNLQKKLLEKKAQQITSNPRYKLYQAYLKGEKEANTGARSITGSLDGNIMTVKITDDRGIVYDKKINVDTSEVISMTKTEAAKPIRQKVSEDKSKKTASAKRTNSSSSASTEKIKTEARKSKKKKAAEKVSKVKDEPDYSTVYDSKTVQQKFDEWGVKRSRENYRSDHANAKNMTDDEVDQAIDALRNSGKDTNLFDWNIYTGDNVYEKGNVEYQHDKGSEAVVRTNIKGITGNIQDTAVKVGTEISVGTKNVGKAVEKGVKDTGEFLKDAGDDVKGLWDQGKAGYNKLKAEWVPKREAAKKEFVKTRDKVNTYGKIATHNPALLFQAALDNYAENADNPYARYMKKNNLTGEQIVSTLRGKYTASKECKTDLDNLIKYIDEHPDDEDTINKRIAEINSKYKQKIPKYTQATKDDINGALKTMQTTSQQWMYKQRTKKLAEMIMEAQEDKILDQKLEGILTKMNKQWGTKLTDNEKLRQDIRDAIRGTKTVFFKYDETMKVLQDKTQKMLEREIQKQLNDRINQSKAWKNMMSMDKKFNDIYRKAGGSKIEKIQQKLDKWNKMSDLDFMLMTTEKMTDTLNSRIKFLGKWGGSLNDLDAKMGKFGLNLGLGEQFTSFEKNFTSQIAASMQNTVRTDISKSLQSVSKITSAVKQATQQIQKIQNQAKELVLKWETTVMDVVKAQEKRIVNNILKSVKISFSGGIGSFKI